MFNFETLKKSIGKDVVDFRTLAKKMHIPHFKNKQFSQFLFNLLKKNIIATTKNQSYFIPQIEKEVQGIIRINLKRGFGFVGDGEEAVFILASNLNSAFNGDKVNVKVFKNPINKKSYQGFVFEIIERNIKTFVGTVKSFNKQLGLIPFDSNIKGIFRFKNPEKLKINDHVKVKIITYKYPIIVDVIKKLGHGDDANMDTLFVIEDANIPYEFNSNTKSETTLISQQINEISETRKDLRSKLIVTIDGDDTKDFDDAINVEKLQNEDYILSIHIADVSNYIKENTSLDEEARLRGTSIYLPNKVIPMLPELLSNGICSLKPNVDRLTITVEIMIDKTGKIKNYILYPSVINSKFKLTYQQVNKYYDNDFSWQNKNLEKMLNSALELSTILRDCKIKKGYVDFEIEEPKIILNEDGSTKKIVVRERLKSEIMIEDFMVLANKTVTKFFDKQHLPIIYRIHDKPSKEQIKNLEKVMNILGIKIQLPDHITNISFMEIINQIKQERFDNFIKIMLLRTMPKAIYDSSNIGHFGLALEAYTHFTSPIRRYSDLMVHRILNQYFNNQTNNVISHLKKDLNNISKDVSLTEQRAVDLERQVIDIKKAEFYEHLIGQTFSGIIVSIKKFGFFVEFPNKVNGLVHILSLSNKNGQYKLLENNYVLSNGKTSFTIGDTIKTKVVKVIKSEGRIELAVSDSLFDASI